MKQIQIENEVYDYSAITRRLNAKVFEWTTFYQGTITRSRKRFLRKPITETVPKFIFRVDINIESPSYTKDDVRKEIFRELELLNRREEIKRGEII